MLSSGLEVLKTGNESEVESKKPQQSKGQKLPPPPPPVPRVEVKTLLIESEIPVQSEEQEQPQGPKLPPPPGIKKQFLRKGDGSPRRARHSSPRGAQERDSLSSQGSMRGTPPGSPSSGSTGSSPRLSHSRMSRFSSSEFAKMPPLDLAKETKFDLTSVKDDLKKYFRDLQNDLDHPRPNNEDDKFDLVGRTGIAHKFYSVKSETFNVNPADEKAREEFIRADYELFFTKLIGVLEKVPTEFLYESFKRLLNHDTATTPENLEKDKIVKEFRDCVEVLNYAGFYSANGKPIHFWCGPNGKKAAYQSAEALADKFVPSISAICKLGELLRSKSENPDVCQDLQKEYRLLSDKAFSVCSAELAAQTTGVVHVYSDASNNHEAKIILRFIVNNFHYDVELPLLQVLLLLGIVFKILTIDCLANEEKLRPAVDFNSPDFRHCHRLAERRESLVGATLPQKTKDMLIWKELGKERPGPLISTVGLLFNQWHRNTKNFTKMKDHASHGNGELKLEPESGGIKIMRLFNKKWRKPSNKIDPTKDQDTQTVTRSALSGTSDTQMAKSKPGLK